MVEDWHGLVDWSRIGILVREFSRNGGLGMDWSWIGGLVKSCIGLLECSWIGQRLSGCSEIGIRLVDW